MGFRFSKWISRNYFGRKKEKKTKQIRTLWGVNRLNISRLWNLSNLWNQRNLRNRYDEKKVINTKYLNAVRDFDFGYKEDNVIREICLLVLFCCFLFDCYYYYFFFSIYLDVQPQDTQVPIGSIREFANMFSLTMGWWNISIRMSINNRALNI